MINRTGFTTPDVSADSVVTLQLTADDGRAPSLPAVQHVLVKNFDHPPVANAPPFASGVPGQELILQGSGSDLEGDLLRGERTRSVKVLLPEVSGVQQVQVQLIVDDGHSSSPPSVTVITVTEPVQVVLPKPKEKAPGCGCTTSEATLVALALAWLLRARLSVPVSRP